MRSTLAGNPEGFPFSAEPSSGVWSQADDGFWTGGFWVACLWALVFSGDLPAPEAKA